MAVEPVAVQLGSVGCGYEDVSGMRIVVQQGRVARILSGVGVHVAVVEDAVVEPVAVEPAVVGLELDDVSSIGVVVENGHVGAAAAIGINPLDVGYPDGISVGDEPPAIDPQLCLLIVGRAGEDDLVATIQPVEADGGGSDADGLRDAVDHDD